MIDIQLTQDGDISLMEYHKLDCTIAFDFHITNSTPIMLSFYVNEQTFDKSHGICFEFDIQSKNNLFKEVKIDKQTSLIQAITLLLRTSKRELIHNLDYGTELERIHYQLYKPSELKSKAEKYIKEALKGLLPYAKVTVYPKKNALGLVNLKITIEDYNLIYEKDWSEL